MSAGGNCVHRCRHKDCQYLAGYQLAMGTRPFRRARPDGRVIALRLRGDLLDALSGQPDVLGDGTRAHRLGCLADHGFTREAMTADHVDLFAGGLGGFSWAGRALGYTTLGIEWDDAAVATREAAGLATLQADVSALDPLDFAPVVGLTGGPPCTAFSMAGKGEGRAALDFYADAITRMGAGDSIDVAELDAACGDERAHLVLEPLRWALALCPRWVACEQVPPVLPLWEAMAAALRAHGYWTWTGLISSETVGVPQTRLRAFMLASLDGPVERPPATHQRYIAPRRREEATGGLFELPEAGRIVAPEDRGLLPWVSMAEALNFGMTARRARVGRAVALSEGTPRANEAARSVDEPAPTLRGPSAHYKWVQTNEGEAWASTCRTAPISATTRPSATSAEPPSHPTSTAWGDATPAEPSATFSPAIPSPSTSAPDAAQPTAPLPSVPPAEVVFRANAQSNACERGADEPAPTITGGHDHNEPATTVNGDPRISEPGHHDADVSGSQQANAVRVSEAEALVLQSFPPDYPLRGSKSARFLTIGNGIPYLLALAVLRAVAGDATREAAA